MKHPVKLNVITREKSVSGTREAVEKKTIRVSGKAYRRMKREKWNKPFSTEEERLAALYLVWEEELAEEHRKG